MEREARKTILSPGESADVSRYTKREGAHARDPLNFTLFRQVERKYKHRNGPLDLSEAIDLKNIANYPGVRSFDVKNIATYSGVQPFKDEFSGSEDSLLSECTPKAFTFDPIPGFLIFPGLLSQTLQTCILNHAFNDCMKHPNLCNLDAIYHLPTEQSLLSCVGKGISASSKRNELAAVEIDNEFIRKVRWFTLGYQYNWTTKEYNAEASPNAFPSLLDKISREIARLAGFSGFVPQAGVGNLYQLKDTLMGHVDRSEKNMEMPLISMSIGHSCVFLMGGATRECPVFPFILNSGDVVLFTQKCRMNYHGVPRILEGTLPAWMKDNSAIPCSIMRSSRLNINVRQVI